MVFWAGNSIVGRVVRQDVPPFMLAFLRWTLALFILLPFSWKHLLADMPRISRHFLIMIALGVFGVASFNALLYWGLFYTTASNALLLQAIVPAFVIAFDFWLFGDRPIPLRVAGVAISTLGVTLIIFQADWSALLALRLNAGDGLILLGAIGWALYTCLLRLKPEIHPLSLLSATIAVGSIILIPFAAAEWREVAAMSWTPTVFESLLYVAIFPSIFAYGLYNSAVEMIGGVAAGQTISLLPIFGAVLAALILREPLMLYHLVGALFICLGISITFLAKGGLKRI